jgi:hypothetical protein
MARDSVGAPTITADKPTPKEPSRVRRWDDLESELGRLFLQSQFSPFLFLLFAPHEYALVVSLLRAQQMKHNARQFVSGRRDRGGLPNLLEMRRKNSPR